MTWQILIFVDYKQGWRALRPTNGKPYEFENEQKALETANMCYPDGFGENIKIREI